MFQRCQKHLKNFSRGNQKKEKKKKINVKFSLIFRESWAVYVTDNESSPRLSKRKINQSLNRWRAIIVRSLTGCESQNKKAFNFQWNNIHFGGVVMKTAKMTWSPVTLIRVYEQCNVTTVDQANHHGNISRCCKQYESVYWTKSGMMFSKPNSRQ